MEDKMYINFLLLRIAICLLLLTPLKTFADDCWVGSLKVKVHEKIDRQYQTKNETYKGSHNVDAEGQVMFSVEEGQLNITSKNVSGYRSSTFFRDTGCVIHEGQTKGNLIEGIMSKLKIHVAYWKLNTDGQSTTKNIKGCMQDPIPPIKSSEEAPDWRFEGIIDPNIGRLRQLCSSVKKTPELGYCNETPQGFSGRMKRSMPPLPDKYSRGEGNEVYEWYAKKVPCECSARIVGLTGDVKINGYPISGERDINLSDAIVETGRRSSVTIKFGNATIKVAPNSSIDLTDTCQKEEKPSVLEVIKGSIRAILMRAGAALGGRGTFIYKGPNAHAGVRGTDFILISGDDKTVVMVLDGEVSFWDINKRKTVTVKKNQKSECEKGAIPTNPVFFNPQEIPEWSI
jgi:hypothetical protein